MSADSDATTSTLTQFPPTRAVFDQSSACDLSTGNSSAAAPTVIEVVRPQAGWDSWRNAKQLPVMTARTAVAAARIRCPVFDDPALRWRPFAVLILRTDAREGPRTFG